MCVADRASECRAKAGSGSSDVADALDEILALDQCTIMVVEYIPYVTVGHLPWPHTSFSKDAAKTSGIIIGHICEAAV